MREDEVVVPDDLADADGGIWVYECAMIAEKILLALEEKSGGAPSVRLSWLKVIESCEVLGLSGDVSLVLMKHLREAGAAALLLQYWKQDLPEVLLGCESGGELSDFELGSVLESVARCTAWLWERHQVERAARVIGYVKCCAEVAQAEGRAGELVAVVGEFVEKYGIAQM